MAVYKIAPRTEYMKGNTMNKNLMAGAGILMMTLLVACNNAKPPDSVSGDVAAARQKAANEVADAQKEAAKDAAAADDKVQNKNRDLNDVNAKGAYDVAMAKADGDHQVALEKCKALNGDAQGKCKDLADADYTASKANAKAAEVAQKQ
jgi:hypothetical protein